MSVTPTRKSSGVLVFIAGVIVLILVVIAIGACAPPGLVFTS